MSVQILKKQYQLLKKQHAQPYQLNKVANYLAMAYLTVKNYQLSHKYLIQAQKYCLDDKFKLSVTINNLACLYKYQGNFKQAKNAIQKSLLLLSEAQQSVPKIQKIQSQADSHLNLCAIYSSQGKHMLALRHSQKAYSLIKNYLKDKNSIKQLGHAFVISLFNQAVQLEYLDQLDKARLLYENAQKLQQKMQHNNNNISTRIKLGLKSCKQNTYKYKTNDLPYLKCSQKKIPILDKQKRTFGTINRQSQ